MRFWGAVLMALLLVLPSQADWLQDGNAPERNGVVEDGGPAWDDVAFRVALPGLPTPESTPVVIGNSAFVLVQNRTDQGDPAPGQNAIVRVDLRDASAHVVVPVAQGAQKMVSDGRRLLVLGASGIDAFDLAGGPPRWHWAPPPDTPIAAGLAFGSASVRDGTLYVVGTLTDAPSATVSHYKNSAFAAAISTANGTRAWLWTAPPVSTQGAAPAVPTGPDLPGTPGVDELGLYSVSLGPVVMVMTLAQNGEGAQGQQLYAMESGRYWALDAGSGTELWGATTKTDYQFVEPRGPAGAAGTPAAWSAPTGTSNVAYAKVDDEIVAFNALQGTRLWSANPRLADQVPDFGGVDLALDGDALYVPTTQTLVRYNALTHQADWRFVLGAEKNGTGLWAGADVATTHDALYAMAILGTAGQLYCIEASTGTLRWRYDMGTIAVVPRLALSGGLVLVAGPGRNVTVLGESPASLRVDAHVGSLAPLPGQSFGADLTSQAGAFGAATRFAADWGDGQRTAWQPSPHFDHTYPKRGAVTARFLAENDGHQSASVPVRLDVGGPRLTWLQTIFAPEYQNWTFFVLGLTVTVVVGVVGFLRLRSRLKVMQRELVLIERAYLANAGRPVRAEAALRDRREHVEELLHNGKLEESKVVLLERRIEELTAQARMSALDRRFHFLPYGMVLRLQGMLKDGAVNEWEHDHFLKALEAEPMTRAQREKVRSLIDSWFQRDSTT
ncbi:MAG: outer membrane protein assembly factor BamB family protein [Thermoplasmatota archaeon]